MTLVSALNLIEEFRGLDSSLDTTLASMFLYVAVQEEVSLSDIAEFTGKPQSTTSRVVGKVLGVKFGLVATKEDPNDWRRKVAYLTPKGKQLARKLEVIVKE